MIGKKCMDKNYYWYIGYSGGIKFCIVGELLEGKYLECVVIVVVKCMLSGNCLFC